MKGGLAGQPKSSLATSSSPNWADRLEANNAAATPSDGKRNPRERWHCLMEHSACHSEIPEIIGNIFFERVYPPAIAPTTRKGSCPEATASGRGMSGDSMEKSSVHA